MAAKWRSPPSYNLPESEVRLLNTLLPVPKVRMFNARTTGGAVNVFGLWLIALVVGGCSGRNVQPGDRDYPETNRSPEKFLRIHGTIDPALDLRFRIEWWSDNRECVYASTWVGAYIEGAGPRIAHGASCQFSGMDRTLISTCP